ncbi:MAG TPA: hypothetical protein P5032_14905 [Candidatus Competibacter sp.]|nr:hypothetical protein [Candidatus Competibacter sp.]
MNLKLMIILTLMTTPAWSDEVLQMPGGGTCMRQSGTGVVFGCSGGSSGNSAADRAQLQEARNNRERMKQYQECLRTSDWPGKPGRSECASIYGQ